MGRCVENVGLVGVGLRREDEISGERKKVLENEGKGACESGKNGVHEVVCGVGQVVEEKASHRGVRNPQHVEERQGEICGGN